MDFDLVIELIRKGLTKPLPGQLAQKTMSPLPIDSRRFDFNFSENPRKGAVLILIYPEGGKACFPLIKRPIYKGVHSGQIAFPGGKMDPEDKDLSFTAIREAWEEVGVLPKDVNLIGQISDLFVPASNFLIRPIIGYATGKPSFVPQIKEVDRIIETPVEQLIHLDTKKQKILEVGGRIKLDAPYFDIQNEVVWGATAMILGEFIQILENGRS
jgi:8-oxo-dGTP pyrophosphatase MutT (NUDIX family)